MKRDKIIAATVKICALITYDVVINQIPVDVSSILETAEGRYVLAQMQKDGIVQVFENGAMYAIRTISD